MFKRLKGLWSKFSPQNDSIKKKDRVLVFIDLENQIMRAKEDGTEIKLPHSLEVLKNHLGCAPDRVFLYTSRKSEESLRFTFDEMLRIDDPTIRYVKSSDGKDAVDKLIRCDTEFFLKDETYTVFVLSTHDGGEEFLTAISAIKKAGKKFFLLRLAGFANHALGALADEQINAIYYPSERRNRKEIFDLYVQRASYGEASSGEEWEFLLDVVRGIYQDPSSVQKISVAILVTRVVWPMISKKWIPRGYSITECMAAINALRYPPGYMFNRTWSLKKIEFLELNPRLSMATRVFRQYISMPRAI